MPSSPSLQECRNTTAPSSSVCSLNTTPSGARRRQPRQLGLALDQRQRSQILAVEQHRVRRLVPPVERIEHGDPVLAGDHRLAVKGERPGAQLRGGRGDRGRVNRRAAVGGLCLLAERTNPLAT